MHLLEAMEQGHWPVTFSIGVLTFLKPPDTVDAMVAEADMLMYSVKHSGKNAMKYEIAVTPPSEKS
jgi:PleD family two-component response regulator